MKHCAYCGATGVALTREHVIPRALYPASKAGSKVQRLTVPACRACNQSWCDDEPHFRNVLAIAGVPNQTARDLWHTTVMRSFDKEDGRRRLSELWEQMRPVQFSSGDRYAVFPASDPRFIRTMRKIVRGLHYHHKLWSPVPDDMVEVDVLRYVVPPEIAAAMPVLHRESDIITYQYEVFEAFEDMPMSSAWLLTFFENRRFTAWVRKPSSGSSVAGC